MADAQAPTPSTIYERLAAPFDVSGHATVNKGGGNQTYAPWTTYVERLNKELQGNWSFRVVREGFTETECWVLGEITATIEGVVVTRQQYGCEPITKGGKPTTDLMKSAASDAIKKAASLLGPGLYLSIKEERMAIEAAMREAVKEAAQAEREKNKPAPKAPAPTNAAAPSGTQASRSAATPPASPAAPTSSSTTVTPAPRTAREALATSSDVQAAAVLTGANPTAPRQIRYRCTECSTDVPNDATLTILKRKDGPKVAVAIADFAPVCAERLGTFHCARCYERKWFGAA